MRDGSKTKSSDGTPCVRGSSRVIWLLFFIPTFTALLRSNRNSVAIGKEALIHKEQTEFSFQQSDQHKGSKRSHSAIPPSKEPPQESRVIPLLKEPHVEPDYIPLQSEQQNSSQTVHLPDAVVPTNNTMLTAAKPKAVPVKSRIFLGIFFSGNANQLRYVHRTTYLNYFSKHHTDTPNRTCTLREFEELLRTTQDHSHFFENDSTELAEACRLVYTFVLEGTERWDARQINKVFRREPDLLILDPKTYPMPSPSSPSSIPSWVRWYQFAMDQNHQWAEQQSLSNPNDVDMSYFDFVAHTDCYVQLRPEEFWKDNPILNTVPGNRSKVFAQGDEFTLLSTDLVKNVVIPNSKNFTAAAGGNDGSDWLTKILGNHLPQPAAPQPLNGIRRFPNIAKKDSWVDLLIMWDEYKDQKLEESGGYEDPQEAQQIRSSKAYDYLRSTNHTTPRLLIGIFTMDSPKDRLRRDALRETYLSYYKNTSLPHRICALTDITRGILTPEQGAECQLVYAFVMGSNPNGTKSLLEPSPSNPIEVDEKDIPPHLLNETDVVHLNIAENMEDGKSPTWIRFATDLVYEQFHFDYVGKIDSDTLLYPDEFLDEVFSKRCPPFPKNIRVYGGFPIFGFWHSVMIGPGYMGGQIYWMSPDLGRFVTSSEFKAKRESVDTHVEDWAMGNFVHSHPWPIRRVKLESKEEGHKHPVKDPEKMRLIWKAYVKSKDN